MNLKRLLSLLFALALATSLSFAQDTSTSQSSDQSTTTTKKSRKSKLKSDAKEAGSATADTAKDVGSAVASGTKTAAKKTKNAVTGDNSKKLDINTATKDELATLPGVGDATAQKIVDGRPYRAKNDLVNKNIVTQGQYDQIKDQIIAHRVKASASASTSGETASSSPAASSSTAATSSKKKSKTPAAPK